MPAPYAEGQSSNAVAVYLGVLGSLGNGATATSAPANRHQGVKDAGQTIAAGGTIATSTITPKTTGKVRVSFSCAGSIDAPINVLLETQELLGPLVKAVSFPATSSGSWVSLSFVFEVDGLTVGTPWTVKGVTTALDGNLTIGNGVDGIGAAVLLEELP
jgi:hypothetical protein